MYIVIINQPLKDIPKERLNYDSVVMGYNHRDGDWSLQAIPEHGSEFLDWNLAEIKATALNILPRGRGEDELSVILSFHGERRWTKRYPNVKFMQVRIEERLLLLITDQEDEISMKLIDTLQKIKVIG